MSWRARFAPRIERVLRTYRGRPHDELAAALRRAYPLAPPWRQGAAHPYRIWRDEIARQRGHKPALRRQPQPARCAHTLELFDPERCPHTLDMFE